MKTEGARQRDALFAVGAGLLAFALYLRTLYPGLNGIGDTPKFQFLGRILGTPHPPGYPVYLLLCAAFARLPFGNPAWRVNLLSAVAASVAVALLYLLMRRLGCRPLVAGAAALAFGFGRVLWSQATLAEVYALAATLLAGLLLATVAWGASRRPRTLDLAVFLAALSLAHHTTVAMVAPALVLYVLATDRRAGVAPGFLGRAALLVVLGLSPYLLILQRTLAGAPYLGARARSLGELWNVMRGSTFEGRLFPFDVATVLTERVGLVGGYVAGELTLPGALLALTGLVVLGRRKPREALLLGLAAAGLLCFALNYDVPDLDVFLVPAFVPLFVLAAVGVEALVAAGRGAAPALAVLALAWPSAQLARNFKANDHSDRTYEMRYFASLFEALPNRSAIAAESYTIDHMVLYEIFGEQAARDRDVITVPADAASIEAVAARGYTVFVLERTRAALEPLGYAFAPVRLLDAPLDEYTRTLPRERILLEAGPSRDGRHASIGPQFDARAVSSTGDNATVLVDAGEAMGTSAVKAPVALRAESLPAGSAAIVGDGEAARSERGIAFAVVGRNGKVVEAHDLDPAEGFRVPFTNPAFPVFRMAFPRQCAEAGGGAWVDASAEAARGRLRLRIDDFETYDARFVLWLGSARPLEPRVGQAVGKGVPQVDSLGFVPGAAATRQALAQDGLDPARLAGASHLTRLELRVNDDGDFATVAIGLGGLPRVAWAKADVDRKSPVRALACGATPGDAWLFASSSASRVVLEPGGDASALLTSGWNAPEPQGFRWTAAREARLLLPFATVASTRVRVRAMPLAIPDAPMQIGLAVGETELPPRGLTTGWAYYEWDVPEAAWRVGTNELAFRTSAVGVPQALGLGPDTRSLGIAVSAVELRRGR